jgi:hypothetical protein
MELIMQMLKVTCILRRGHIFWSTIRSLDLGLGFKSTGFHNLHMVFSELVNFLLVNTRYKSTSILDTKVSQLGRQNSELQKTAKNAEKSWITASDKADKLKKLCESLVKRITQLKSQGAAITSKSGPMLAKQIGFVTHKLDQNA